MTVLRVSLFHTLCVSSPEGGSLDLGSPTTRSLFAYLLLNRAHPNDRRRLAFLFWPHVSESAARRNLRQYLHRLRRALEPIDPQGSLLLADETAVQINPHTQVWLDVDAFRQALRPEASLEELRSAAELYTGDLLEDVYEDWCQEERRVLRQAYLSILDRLSQALHSLGRLEEAIACAHRWVQADNLDEAAHRRLLSLYAANGDRNRALQHYLSLKEILARELQAEPLPETQALFQSIQSGSGWPKAGPLNSQPPTRLVETGSRARARNEDFSTPLVGRQAELHRMETVLESADQGCGSFLLVTGESGIGKTRLLQEYLDRRPTVIRLHSLCHELESNAPYAPLRHALAQAVALLPEAAFQTPPAWLVTLAQFIPNLAAYFPFLPPQDSVQLENPRLVEAIAQLALSLNRHIPPQAVHLILDDLHWADGRTWETLAQLAHRAATQPLLILGLCRLEDLPLEYHRAIRTLERNDLLTHLPLERLTPSETATLARHLLASQPADPLFLSRLYRETEGNPFFVIETVRAMQEAGRPSLPLERSAGSLAAGLPLSIQRVIEARLDRLSPESQELLRCAAAVGRAFTLSLLEEIGQTGTEACVQFIEEWCQRGLVREAGFAYDFSHDKIRQVAYSGLSHARRQLIHRRIAAVFENSIPPSDSATLAHHFARSDQPFKALPYLTQAGEQALRARSYQEARQIGLQAVSLLVRMPGPRQRSERIDLNLQLAQAYAFSGDVPRALEILGETERLASALGDDERLGKIFHRSAQLFWLRGQSEVAGDYARRALRSAEERNDVSLLQAALRMLGRTGIALSAFDDAIAYLVRYVNLENGFDRPPDLPIVLGYLGIAYARVGSWERALEVARRGLALAESEGSKETIAFARMQLGFVHADRRQWRDCLEMLHAAIALQEPDKARPGRSEAGSVPAVLTPLDFMLNALLGRALAHQGAPEKGLPILRRALDWAEQNDYRVFHYLARMFLAESLCLDQQAGSAQREAQRCLEQARAAGNRWAAAVAQRILAECLVRGPAPDWSSVENHLIESMQTLRQIRARPDLARTYLALRRLYDRAGQIAWAVDCHFRATTIFEELGMIEELRTSQGQAAGDRRGAAVISDMRLRGPNTSEE